MEKLTDKQKQDILLYIDKIWEYDKNALLSYIESLLLLMYSEWYNNWKNNVYNILEDKGLNYSIKLNKYKHYCDKHNNRDITCKECNENTTRNNKIDAQEQILNNIIIWN